MPANSDTATFSDREFDEFFDDAEPAADEVAADQASADAAAADVASAGEPSGGVIAAPEARPREAAASEKPSWRDRFRQWRRARPFAGGLLMIISGIIMVAPAYFTVQISDLLVMISTISGVSTLLIGALLIMFGIGTWLQPATATYLGVLAILVAIVAVPTSNLGGFFVGSLIGIIGGALAIGWEDTDRDDAAGRPKHAKSEDDARQANGAISSVGKAGAAVVLCAATAGLATVGESPAPAQAQPAAQGEPMGQQEPPAQPSQPLLGSVPSLSSQNLSKVTADDVSLLGNVHATMGTAIIDGREQRTLVLTGDQLIAQDLSLDIPGLPGRGLLTTGQVKTKVSDGPVRVVAAALDATPAVGAVSTVPVSVDFGGTVTSVLEQLGVQPSQPVPDVGIPDVVMDHVSLRDVTMQMVSLYGKHFDAPVVKLTSHPAGR